jgi:hypothetical protein
MAFLKFAVAVAECGVLLVVVRDAAIAELHSSILVSSSSSYSNSLTGCCRFTQHWFDCRAVDANEREVPDRGATGRANDARAAYRDVARTQMIDSGRTICYVFSMNVFFLFQFQKFTGFSFRFIQQSTSGSIKLLPLCASSNHRRKSTHRPNHHVFAQCIRSRLSLSLHQLTTAGAGARSRRPVRRRRDARR